MISSNMTLIIFYKTYLVKRPTKNYSKVIGTQLTNWNSIFDIKVQFSGNKYANIFKRGHF